MNCKKDKGDICMKKGRIILFTIMIMISIISIGCGSQETSKELTDEGVSIIGQWKSTVMLYEGVEMELDPIQDEDMMVNIEVFDDGKYKFEYDQSSVVGKWKEKGDTYISDIIEGSKLEVTLKDGKLRVAITEDMEEPDNVAVWLCEKQE